MALHGVPRMTDCNASRFGRRKRCPYVAQLRLAVLGRLTITSLIDDMFSYSAESERERVACERRLIDRHAEAGASCTLIGVAVQGEVLDRDVLSVVAVGGGDVAGQRGAGQVPARDCRRDRRGSSTAAPAGTSRARHRSWMVTASRLRAVPTRPGLTFMTRTWPISSAWRGCRADRMLCRGRSACGTAPGAAGDPRNHLRQRRRSAAGSDHRATGAPGAVSSVYAESHRPGAGSPDERGGPPARRPRAAGLILTSTRR